MAQFRRAGSIALALFVVAGSWARAQPVEGEKAREDWQRVPDIVAATRATAGSAVADIGAGYGFLSGRLSPIVGGGGRVYAVDSGEDALRNLRQRVTGDHLDNVTVIAGDEHDPHLPAGALDAAVVINAYHEFTFFDEMLAHIRDALKPCGRLVIVEPVPQTEGQTRPEQIKAHVIYPDLVAEDLTRAGFVVVLRDDRFVKRTDMTGEYYQSLVVAERSAGAAPSQTELTALRFLLGEWDAAAGASGETGQFTFALAVQDRVMTRTNDAVYPAANGKPALRHDDLMVIYVERGRLKADYFDSEQYVIRYTVEPRSANEAVFLSEPTASEPRYRLTYTLGADGVLTGRFDIAPPGAADAFKPYLTWIARRSR